MIHIDLDKGDFRVSGTGKSLLEEHKAITARLMNHMAEAGMDKAWIYDEMRKKTLEALSLVFPEVDDEQPTNRKADIRKTILSDFFKKG